MFRVPGTSWTISSRTYRLGRGETLMQGPAHSYNCQARVGSMLPFLSVHSEHLLCSCPGQDPCH